MRKQKKIITRRLDMATKQKSAICAVLTALLLAMGFIGCGGEENELAAHKKDAIAILTAHVQDLNPEKYSNENWLAIEQIANTGKENINMAVSKPEVNTALNTALKEIHMVDYEGRDFVLTISVEETTLPRGESFKVDVELKNNTGEDHVIHFSRFFWPFIQEWHIFDDLDVVDGVTLDPQPIFFEKDSTIRDEGRVGITFKPDTHELRFMSGFYINYDQENQQEIVIWSNTVLLTVQ